MVAGVMMGRPIFVPRKGLSKHSWPRSKPRTLTGSTSPPHFVQVEAASSKSRELFKKIFDLSLSETELGELAEALDGFNISTENPPKSTAKVEVILQKPATTGAYTKRKVTVRHEKKGWGVLDIAGPMEFKSIGVIRRNTGTGGGRR